MGEAGNKYPFYTICIRSRIVMVDRSFALERRIADFSGEAWRVLGAVKVPESCYRILHVL